MVDLQPKDGVNARIFKETLIRSRQKTASSQLRSKVFSNSSNIKFNDKSQISLNQNPKKLCSKDSLVTLNPNSSAILSIAYKGDSLTDFKNSSNAFIASSSQNEANSNHMLLSRKNSPAITYFSGKDAYSLNKGYSYEGNSFPVKEKKKETKILIFEDKNIIDLQQKILSHENNRPKFSKKEATFKFDNSFMGSRKLQVRKFDFDQKNGLLPKSTLNSSFGR